MSLKQSQGGFIWILVSIASLALVDAHAEDSYTVYGKARASVNVVDNGANSVTSVASNSSRLGVKGTEDLGGDLKAIFQFETLVNLDDGAGSTSSLFGVGRNTFVGVSGGLGAFVLGNYDTPYKESTSTLDVSPDSLGDYNAIIGAISDNTSSAKFDRREPNTINYWSPKFANAQGFGFKLQYRPDESATANQDRYSLAVAYDNGPYYASLAHEVHRDETTVPRDTHGTKLGLGYTWGQSTKLGFVYESLSEQDAATAYDRNAWYLRVAHKIENNTVKLAHGQTEANDLQSDSGANFYLAGITHHLSKRTELYALYVRVNNDANARYVLGAGNGSTTAAAAGNSIAGFSVGLNHDF
ncbi:MAG TPA: porin [Gammaproteobacteria bacterium]|nr:porin [Gammaproteobacteria bacterium]